MQKNKGTKSIVMQEEPRIFQDQLPEEILEELTPEIRRQYFLWDEITKREVQLYPWIVLPLIEEIFQRKYPEDVEIKLLSTEYAVKRINKNGEKLLQSIYSDLLLRIGKDLYHLECQMEENRDMVLRMFEYDVHIALTHSPFVDWIKDIGTGSYDIYFPQSVILYLGSSRNTPEYETCTIHFNRNESYTYKVPVLKVQEYSPSMIKEKHLNMLIPFLPIRFRKAVESSSARIREQARNNLTELLLECIMILKQERENGTLTEAARNDLTEFLSCACDHLFAEDSSLIKEVHEILEPAVKLRREIVQELQEENKDLQEENKDLQEENKDLQKDKKDLQGKLQNVENGLAEFIRESKADGTAKEEVLHKLQKFFVLSEKEAKEKIVKYWDVEKGP